VIGALEDAEYDKAFEAAIIADHDVQSTVEPELVLRLASGFNALAGSTECAAAILGRRTPG
jgi:hypothetical protein